MTSISDKQFSTVVSGSSNIWNMYGFLDAEEIRSYNAVIEFDEELCTQERIVVYIDGNKITFAMKGTKFWVLGENWNVGPLDMHRPVRVYNQLLHKVTDKSARLVYKEPVIKNNRIRHIIASLCAQVS